MAPSLAQAPAPQFGGPAGGSAQATTEGSQLMLDVFMLVIGIGFFALAVVYALACDRL
jgi:hypothetical protein